jgi:hypothetical protein
MLDERRAEWTWAAFVIAIASFCFFAHYRARFIGACDPSAYLAESLRLFGRDAGLARDPLVPQQGALVPLCMVDHHGVVRSFFPPGFSILLGAFGVVGLAFYVTALSGASGALALFFLARSRAGAPIALATMIAWLAAPMTTWGSTQLMSDGTTAALLLVALALTEGGRAFLGGLVLGFAVGVRPTSVLFFPALLLLVLWPTAPSLRAPVKTLGWLCLGGAVAGLGWLAFAVASFGGLELPYMSNLHAMTGMHFGHQLGFFFGELVTQHAPISVLAAVALVWSPRASAPFVVWIAPYIVFHSYWGARLDAWWEARFIAPAFPALFLLAATGAAKVRGAMGRAPRVFAYGGVTVVALYAGWSYSTPDVAWFRSTTWDERYARASLHIAELVPHDAFVGAINYSMPLRYYGRLQSFIWFSAETPAMIRWALDAGRPVYAVLDAVELRSQAEHVELRRELDFTLVEDLDYGVRWTKLSRARELAAIDVGEPSARGLLREGWSEDERDRAISFAEIAGARATLAVPPSVPAGARVLVALVSGEGRDSKRALELRAAGESLGRERLEGGYQVVEVRLPAHAAIDELELVLDGSPVSPIRIDWVSFRAAGAQL